MASPPRGSPRDKEHDHTLNKSLGWNPGRLLGTRRAEGSKEVCQGPGVGSLRSKLKSGGTKGTEFAQGPGVAAQVGVGQSPGALGGLK